MPASRSMLSRFGTVHTLMSGALRVMSGVADLTDQLLQHILERDQTQHGPVLLHDTCHVCTLALETLQRRVEHVVRTDGSEGTHPLVVHHAVAAGLVDLEHVLDVQVSQEAGPVPDDGEAAEAGGGA